MFEQYFKIDKIDKIPLIKLPMPDTESSFMLLLYVGYILTMHFNARIYQFVLAKINQYTTSEFSEKVMNMDTGTGRGQLASNMGSSHYRSFQEEAYNLPNVTNILPPSQHLNKTSMFEAACHVIIQHNRLFRPLTRFRAAADLIMIQQRKIKISQYQPNNLGTLSRRDSVVSRSKMSITEDVEEYWRSVPNYQEQGPLLFAKWVVVAPLYAALHYTVPNCKKNQSMFMATFLVSIVWIALFSYLMVWMVSRLIFNRFQWISIDFTIYFFCQYGSRTNLDNYERCLIYGRHPNRIEIDSSIELLSAERHSQRPEAAFYSLIERERFELILDN